MSLREHFVQMARNNAWSNVRVYAACRALDHDALIAPRVSFFPSLLATLQHIWIVDEYYVGGLEGDGTGYAIFEREHEHGEIEALYAAQRAVDERLLAFCAACAPEANVALQRRSGPKIDRVGDVLAHLFVHQIHHRGQVHAMLAGTKLAPPQLDEWFLEEDRARAEPELRAARGE